MECVTELVALGAQVARVVGVGLLLDRYLARDRQPIALEATDLLRVVGEDADRRKPEVNEDLRTDAVVAQVRRQTQTFVGLDKPIPRPSWAR